MSRAGNVCFGFAETANYCNLLFISAYLGKHAEVEHRAHVVRKLHNDVGVIQNVCALAVIKLVEMVYVLCATCHHAHGRGLRDQIHEVEEVATLFYERSAGVARKPIPVVDLF